MGPLITAIQTKFAATSGITTVITGGLWLSEPAEGTAYPFAEIEVVSSETGARFGGRLPYECEVMFKCYANSVTGAMTAMATITAAFDEFLPDLGSGNGKCYYSNRISEPYPYRVPTEERVQRDASVNPIYCSVATYRYACHPN